MQSKKEILDMIEKNRDKLKDYGVLRLGLFGSFARNQQNDSSDIDLIIEFLDGKKNFRNFMGSYNLLEQLFQRKIELITEDSLKDFMKSNILKETEYVFISK